MNNPALTPDAEKKTHRRSRFYIFDGYGALAFYSVAGGLGFMLNGNMCVGVTNNDLMVRVGAEGHQEALSQPHARPRDFTGRPMNGFVFVGSPGIDDDASLQLWLHRGLTFAETLPKK